MRKKNFHWLVLGLVPLLVTAYSCSTGESANQIVGTSSSVPAFRACRVISGTEIEFHFSQPVTVLLMDFTPPQEIETIENGELVRVCIAEGHPPGEKLTVDLLATDEQGNTINVLALLRTKNERMPKMVINELRTEYSKPKCEFIEFKMLTAGNLAAMRVFIAGNKTPLVYEFSPIEVRAGEYILLHLRTLDDTSRDEYGNSKNASGGVEAREGVRDFWVPGTAKLLRKTDAVYVLDQDDNVLDAVMLSATHDQTWNKEYMATVAEFLSEKNAWASDTFVDSSKATATRTICRNETKTDTNTSVDWYVTVTSGNSPGGLNNQGVFK